MNAPRTPPVTVDVVLRVEGGIVLIRRKHPPLGWALPGGFVDVGETVEHAAAREALEETGLHVTLDELLCVYSDPARDPRGQTVSITFLAHAEGTPQGGDDAADAAVFPIDGLPTPLAFDHALILDDYVRFLASGERPRPVDRQG